MINTKSSTKTWRDTPLSQEAGVGLDQQQVNSLTKDQKDKLGAEDLGTVLNKVADPNYIDPSKKVNGRGDSKMDKDAFFKVMMAQLKNQDPTNPLKNHEMAAQLAQFSSLEQMTNMNTTLNEIKGGNKPIEQFQALNLIGKEVSGDSAKITRSEIDKDHEIKFNLPQDAKTLEVQILNSKNDVIRKFNFSELKTGENKIIWNGMNERGANEKAGDFKVKFEGIGSNGQKINVKTDFTGIVSGLTFSSSGPVLQVGKQAIRLKDVKQFADPSLKSNDQNSKDITELDLKKVAQGSQNKVKEETKSAEQIRAENLGSDNLLSEVNMSGALFDKIKNGKL